MSSEGVNIIDIDATIVGPSGRDGRLPAAHMYSWKLIYYT